MKKALIKAILFLFVINITYANPPKEDQHKLCVYPNPAKDYINLKVLGVEEIDHIRIYNKEGALVKIITNIFDENTIDLSAYQPGNYLIVAFHKNGMLKESFEISEKANF